MQAGINMRAIPCRSFETDTRCQVGGFLAALFSALLALAVFGPDVATAQEVKQIKFTEKHMQGFIAVSEEMAKLYDGANLDKPDAKLEAQAEALVKKNGFANLAEYDDVSMNIAMIMSGIDPQTKKFTEPPNKSSSRSTRLSPTNPCRKHKRRGFGAARDRAQERKAHSVQGKHCTRAKVL